MTVTKLSRSTVFTERRHLRLPVRHSGNSQRGDHQGQGRHADMSREGNFFVTAPLSYSCDLWFIPLCNKICLSNSNNNSGYFFISILGLLSVTYYHHKINGIMIKL